MSAGRTGRSSASALLLLALVLMAGMMEARAAVSFGALEPLTPGEQYRQLSLLSLVAGGVPAELIEELQPLVGARDARLAAGEHLMELALDDYATPLARIVDQDVLLAGAADLFTFARANSAGIQARMTQIARDNPILISMVDVNELTADAILIRTAIADSIEYSGLVDPAVSLPGLQEFRDRTVYLRNMLEFNQFQEELAQITQDAIVDLGGRLDAYQRMFNENVDPDLVKRRVESAEIMNRQTGSHFEEQAMQRNAELLMMLILLETQAY